MKRINVLWMFLLVAVIVILGAIERHNHFQEHGTVFGTKEIIEEESEPVQAYIYMDIEEPGIIYIGDSAVHNQMIYDFMTECSEISRDNGYDEHMSDIFLIQNFVLKLDETHKMLLMEQAGLN